MGRGVAVGALATVAGGPGGSGRGVVNEVSAWSAIRSGTTRYRPASLAVGRVAGVVG